MGIQSSIIEKKRREIVKDLVRLSISNAFATRIAIKYFKNEIIFKDLDALKENFNTKYRYY